MTETVTVGSVTVEPESSISAVRIGLIVQHETGCDANTRRRIVADITPSYDILPPQDVQLFTHPETRHRHAMALLGVARIIQTHTGVDNTRTLQVLGVLTGQYTFTPREDKEEAA